MKKISLLLASTVIFLGLSGCSGTSDPGEAAVECMNGLKTGDIDMMNSCLTDSSQQLFKLQASVQCRSKDLNTEEGASNCYKKIFKPFDEFKSVNVKMDGEDSAIVTLEEYKKDGTIIKERIPMERFDGVWKINIHK